MWWYKHTRLTNYKTISPLFCLTYTSIANKAQYNKHVNHGNQTRRIAENDR
jgi:hypothetical protein